MADYRCHGTTPSCCTASLEASPVWVYSIRKDKRGCQKTQNEFFNTLQQHWPRRLNAPVLSFIKSKSRKAQSKNDQECTKNPGIPTGIFKGLLKTSSFLTAPKIWGRRPVLAPSLFCRLSGYLATVSGIQHFRQKNDGVSRL